INAGLYSVAPAPDGSVWGSVLGFPGAIVRLSPGANPPETALAEIFELPVGNPYATGQHCPEGWTFYSEPLPQLKGVTDPGSAEASYYTWVDQFDTAGFGKN